MLADDVVLRFLAARITVQPLISLLTFVGHGFPALVTEPSDSVKRPSWAGSHQIAIRLATLPMNRPTGPRIAFRRLSGTRWASLIVRWMLSPISDFGSTIVIG